MNPWIAIWTSPRHTIRKIVAENPNKNLWILAWIYGFCSLMNLFQSIELGRSLSPIAIAILGVIIAPIYGYVCFTVWSWFVTWVGKWFKGEGQFKEVRSAYAWSCVPITLNIPLWLLMVTVFGHQLFLNFPRAELLPNGMVTFLFVILVAKVILAVWSLVIYLNALSEVQKFSVLRAILNVVVAGIIITLIVFVLWALLVHALGGHLPTAFMLWKNFLA